MKRWLIGGIAGLGALVIAGGATAYALNATPTPEPTPTVVAVVVETPKPVVTPKPTPTPLEVAVVAPEPVIEEVPPPPPPAPEPVYCPGGSFAVGQDGINDTLCLPNECEFNSGNPDYPQCDVAFKP
jgi:acetyl esterase/lipase